MVMLEEELSPEALRRRQGELAEIFARIERELAEAERAAGSADRRAELGAEAKDLEVAACAAAEEAERCAARLKALRDQHQRVALKLREAYPGSLPDQLITALLDEQPPRRIAELECAVVRAQVLKPVYVAVLNELFRRMDRARHESRLAKEEEEALRRRAAALQREAAAIRSVEV
jgi:hypothetical protein